MFRVALVLIRSVLGSSHQIAECPGLYEILDRLRHIPAEFKEQEYLVREVITLRKKFKSFRAIFTVIVREENLVFLVLQCSRLPISDSDMEKEHKYQLKKRRNATAVKPEKRKATRATSRENT